MEEQIVSFEVAKLAKEKGFNGKCIAYYNTFKDITFNSITDWEYTTKQCLLGSDAPLETYKVGIARAEYLFKSMNSEESHKKSLWDAPTQSLLQRWLRETHNIHVFVASDYNYSLNKIIYYSRIREIDLIEKEVKEEWGNSCNTYEEALEVGLLNALKSIKT